MRSHQILWELFLKYSWRWLRGRLSWKRSRVSSDCELRSQVCRTHWYHTGIKNKKNQISFKQRWSLFHISCLVYYSCLPIEVVVDCRHPLCFVDGLPTGISMDFGPPEALLWELHLEAVLDAGFHSYTQASLQCLAHIDRFYLEFPKYSYNTIEA